jgi:hypothetical protein
MTRSLDGVDPHIGEEIHHTAEHVPGIQKVVDVKARWLGHKLHTDVSIVVDDTLSVADAAAIASALKKELHAHLPPLGTATVQIESPGMAARAFPGKVDTGFLKGNATNLESGAESAHGHHHARLRSGCHHRWRPGFWKSSTRRRASGCGSRSRVMWKALRPWSPFTGRAARLKRCR